MMKTTAAVLVELGRPLELWELSIPPLAPGQVLVEIVYSGVCHTQLSEVRGRRGEDPYLPHCLGHEGSGIVREVGPGVTKVRPEDRVVLSWIQGTGAQVPGTRYQRGQQTVHAGGITTFGRHAVISENRLTPLPDGLSMEVAALLGCAVPTGIGSLWNTAQARPGSSVAVFGTGGVGLCAIAAAALTPCHPVIAVDILDEKLELARSMGATHTVNAGHQDAVAAIGELTSGGVDIAIEASGQPAVMCQALQSVRPRGGAAVIVGNAPHGRHVELDPRQLNLGKRLLGTWGGDSQPDRDTPRYAQLVLAGRLDLQPLIGKRYPLGAVNEALADLEHGRAARPLIDMNHQLDRRDATDAAPPA